MEQSPVIRASCSAATAIPKSGLLEQANKPSYQANRHKFSEHYRWFPTGIPNTINEDEHKRQLPSFKVRLPHLKPPSFLQRPDSTNTLHHFSTPKDLTSHRCNQPIMPGRDRGISYDASPHTKEMPRVLCPKCTTTEKEVWVMPGHSCPYCGYVVSG